MNWQADERAAHLANLTWLVGLGTGTHAYAEDKAARIEAADPVGCAGLHAEVLRLTGGPQRDLAALREPMDRAKVFRIPVHYRRPHGGWKEAA